MVWRLIASTTRCAALLQTRRMLLLLLSVVMANPTCASVFSDVPLLQYPATTISTLKQLDPHKPVYIKLWATWCQPCMQQMPHFQALQQQYGDKVQFVAVNIDINESTSAIAKVVDTFKLTMPIWRDVQGELAVKLGLVGTPLSVLFNAQQHEVYRSHTSDAALDGLVQRLASGQQLPVATADSASDAIQQQLLAPYLRGEHLLFISATWCDWYLKESRPAMAQQCDQAQRQLGRWQQLKPAANWQVLVNHLWTDDKAVAEFRDKYQLTMPVQIDSYGVLFQHFNVRHIPQLLHIIDGKVVQRIDDVSDVAAVSKQLR